MTYFLSHHKARGIIKSIVVLCIHIWARLIKIELPKDKTEYWFLLCEIKRGGILPKQTFFSNNFSSKWKWLYLENGFDLDFSLGVGVKALLMIWGMTTPCHLSLIYLVSAIHFLLYQIICSMCSLSMASLTCWNEQWGERERWGKLTEKEGWEAIYYGKLDCLKLICVCRVAFLVVPCDMWVFTSS